MEIGYFCRWCGSNFKRSLKKREHELFCERNGNKLARKEVNCVTSQASPSVSELQVALRLLENLRVGSAVWIERREGSLIFRCGTCGASSGVKEGGCLNKDCN